MVTGASTADLAVILIDARKGVLTQTRRHSYLVSLLGIRQVVLAINKMDLVDYSQEVFDAIEADYREFAAELGLTDVTCIPISAVHGRQHRRTRSANTPWYAGPTLIEHSRDRRRRRRRCRGAVPAAGAVGEPAGPGFPRIRRARSSRGTVRVGRCDARRCRPAGQSRVARIVDVRPRSGRGRSPASR